MDTVMNLSHVMYQKSIECSSLFIDLTFQSYLLIYRAEISIESVHIYSNKIIDASMCVLIFQNIYSFD